MAEIQRHCTTTVLAVLSYIPTSDSALEDIPVAGHAVIVVVMTTGASLFVHIPVDGRPPRIEPSHLFISQGRRSCPVQGVRQRNHCGQEKAAFSHDLGEVSALRIRVGPAGRSRTRSRARQPQKGPLYKEGRQPGWGRGRWWQKRENFHGSLKMLSQPSVY
ncbi:hypothetical protein F5Y14DRAFT_458382 [Nemania sp. NC0429]|nr:hypothetical protein F5Y14DRAFT_458382 [Nemania sp. NC0429]